MFLQMTTRHSSQSHIEYRRLRRRDIVPLHYVKFTIRQPKDLNPHFIAAKSSEDVEAIVAEDYSGGFIVDRKGNPTRRME